MPKKNSLLNFFMDAQARLTPNFLRAQMWSLHQKYWEKFTIHIAQSWVPRLLPFDYKQMHLVIIFKVSLAVFDCNSDVILRRFITVDETWIRCFAPGMKQQLYVFLDRSATNKSLLTARCLIPFNYHLYGRLIQTNIMPTSWICSTMNWRKNFRIWLRRKCSISKTMYWYTFASLIWLVGMN